MKYFSSLLFLLISFSTSFATAISCKNIFSVLKEKKPLYEGIQEAQKMIQLGKKLQVEKARAYTTHIPEFAQQINKHYEHFEYIIETTHLKIQEKKHLTEFKKDRNQKIINKKRVVLKSLKAEALQHAQNQNLTYAYWLHWNVRATLVASIHSLEKLEDLKNESSLYLDKINERVQAARSKVSRNKLKKSQKLEILNQLEREARERVYKNEFDLSYCNYHKYLCNIISQTKNISHFHKLRREHKESNAYPKRNPRPDFLAKVLMSIENFPHLIALPTSEKMGVVALNQFESGIVPLGLGGVNAVADGDKLNPFLFMSHDINHHHVKKFGYPSSMIAKWTDPNISKEEFQKEFFQIINKYPLEKKEQAEIAFFFPRT